MLDGLVPSTPLNTEPRHERGLVGHARVVPLPPTRCVEARLASLFHRRQVHQTGGLKCLLLRQTKHINGVVHEADSVITQVA